MAKKYVQTGSAGAAAAGSLGSGTADGTKYLRDDGVWTTPAGIVAAAHATTHLSSGSDPIAAASTTVRGTVTTTTATSQVVSTDDSRNTDARTPLAHTHPESDVTGLVSDLAGKASTTHTHVEGDVTGLVADLAAKANKIAYASGGAAGGTPVSGGYGFISSSEMLAHLALVENIRLALVSAGIMT